MLTRSMLTTLYAALAIVVVGAQETAAPDNATVAKTTQPTFPPPICPNAIKDTDTRGKIIKSFKDSVDLRLRCCHECIATPACIAFNHKAGWMGGDPVPMEYTCELISRVDRFIDMSGIMDVFFETTIVPKRP